MFDGVGKFFKKFLFNISGILKFFGVREVFGKNGKEVLLRKILVYGIYYGIGVFCLIEVGEL